jgi:hypothetical protein
VDLSCLPLHDGIFKNTFWELWFLGLDQTPSFSRTSSDTSCYTVPEIKHTQIYVVRQFAYSTELLVCINQSKKQYKQRGGENSSQLNSTHSSSLYSSALVLSILCTHPQLFNVSNYRQSRGQEIMAIMNSYFVLVGWVVPTMCFHFILSGRWVVPTSIKWEWALFVYTLLT